MIRVDVERILTTKESTDDVSMISLAVLKAEISYRLQTLAFGVQDDNQQHRMLKPGEIWWIFVSWG